MKFKYIIGIILAVVVVVAIVWATNAPDNDKEIKIGVVAPLTGGGAAFGQSLVKGAELAMKEIKDTKHTYKLVVEDDGGSAATAASAASKLINTDHVKAILTVTGITGNAVKPIAEAAHVLHIADTADTSVGSGEYNFTNSILPTDEMPGWLTEAAAHGTKKLAVLYQTHPGIMPTVGLLKKLAPQYGIEVVSFEGFEGSQRDFKTIALKAKQTGADTYFVASYPPALDIVSKDLMTLGITNISTYALFAISPTPEIYNGKWYTDANLADPSFMDQFKSAYPEIRFNVRTAPYGFDMVKMTVDAFEKSSDAHEYMKMLTSYDGKVGKVTKQVGGHNFRSAPAVWTIENGIPKVVKVLQISE